MFASGQSHLFPAGIISNECSYLATETIEAWYVFYADLLHVFAEVNLNLVEMFRDMRRHCTHQPTIFEPVFDWVRFPYPLFCRIFARTWYGVSPIL